MIKFDNEGHIYPYEITDLSLKDFKTFFVDNLEEQLHRQTIFEQYIVYGEKLKAIFKVPFYQLVDGSFTTKKQKPNDIDVVTFIDYDLMMKNIGLIPKLEKPDFSPKVDGHFSYVCKRRHRFYQKSLEYKTFWETLYSNSRANLLGIKKPKGLIRINFQP